jgi:hypothetical protein
LIYFNFSVLNLSCITFPYWFYPTSYTLLWAVFYSKFLPRGISKTDLYELFNINEIWMPKCQNLRIDMQIYDNNIYVCEIWVQTPSHIYPKSIDFYDRKNTSQFNNFSFNLGIFTRESYNNPEQSIHIILKADGTPSLSVVKSCFYYYVTYPLI